MPITDCPGWGGCGHFLGLFLVASASIQAKVELHPHESSANSEQAASGSARLRRPCEAPAGWIVQAMCAAGVDRMGLLRVHGNGMVSNMSVQGL